MGFSTVAAFAVRGLAGTQPFCGSTPGEELPNNEAASNVSTDS